MNSVTLILPRQGIATSAVHIDYAGDGIVLVTVGTSSPVPNYFETNQEAKEFVVTRSAEYLRKGYRIYTGDGITA